MQVRSQLANDKKANVRALSTAGRCALAVGEKERARDYLEKARTFDATNLDVLRLLADLAMDAGEHADALRHYQSVVLGVGSKLPPPELSQLYVQMADAREGMGEHAKSVQMAERASRSTGERQGDRQVDRAGRERRRCVRAGEGEATPGGPAREALRCGGGREEGGPARGARQGAARAGQAAVRRSGPDRGRAHPRDADGAQAGRPRRAPRDSGDVHQERALARRDAGHRTARRCADRAGTSGQVPVRGRADLSRPPRRRRRHDLVDPAGARGRSIAPQGVRDRHRDAREGR